jgi:hypothetical protein
MNYIFTDIDGVLNTIFMQLTLKKIIPITELTLVFLFQISLTHLQFPLV